MSLQIDIDAEALAAFCRRASIRRLSFFGSVLREDFGPESDIDVLVGSPPILGSASSSSSICSASSPGSSTPKSTCTRRPA